MAICAQWRRQAFQTRGGDFIPWKIIGGGHAKKQATKKRYHFITLGVQHSVHLFIHAEITKLISFGGHMGGRAQQFFGGMCPPGPPPPWRRHCMCKAKKGV